MKSTVPGIVPYSTVGIFIAVHEYYKVLYLFLYHSQKIYPWSFLDYKSLLILLYKIYPYQFTFMPSVRLTGIELRTKYLYCPWFLASIFLSNIAQDLQRVFRPGTIA